MRICLLFVFLLGCTITAGAYAQDAPSDSLAQEIEILKLKLQLAEQQLEKLQAECEALRKENAKLKNEKPSSGPPAEDQFAPGVVWVGASKAGGADEKRWALSISKRDGEKFEGAVATGSPGGDKVEFPVTGRAPRTGDGLVIIESPLIGRAKIFMRGTVRNGAVALAFSGTSPLGKKVFGAATLSPKN